MSVSYLEFIEATGLQLTAGQAEFARVAFDGQHPTAGSAVAQRVWGKEFTSTSAEAASWSALERAKRLPPVAKRVAAAVCGRGSGKSLLGGTRVLHLAMTVDVSRLAAREIAFCPVVAPDLDTAQQVVRFALGAAERLGLQISQRQNGGESGFTINRAGGKKVRIVARSASVGGRSIRGRSMPCAVLDEACFFRDSKHKVNDQDIYDALLPRIMPGGQLIILSSPWIEAGLLYDLWRRNYDHPLDALVAHAPTSLMRTDDVDVLAAIDVERQVDPEKCARERDAQFMTSIVNAFFDARAIADMLTHQEFDPIQNSTRTVGGDFAFRKNATSFAAIQTYGKGGVDGDATYETLGLYERLPRGTPLKPSEICSDAIEFAKDVGCDEIVADGHYRETIAEYLHNAKLSHIIAPEGAQGKAEVYQVARSLIHEGKVKLPIAFRGDAGLTEKLLRQMREVVSRPLAGGAISIDSPTWRTGEHGDMASAFVLALWRAYKIGWDAPVKTQAQVKADAAKAAGIDDLERQYMELDREADERDQRFERMTGMSGWR